jgi:predicted RNase H-like nuclease (RuvC/YqgF family)
MTRVLITLLIAFIATTFSFAQVSEKTMTMSLGTQNGMIVSIPGADEDLIEDMWKDYVKEFGKVKRNRKTKEYFGDDIQISSISGAGTMDIYSKTEDGQLIVFFDMGNGFLSKATHKEAYKAAEVFLTEFKHEVTRDMIREELKDEEKDLSKLERELDGLKRDNDNYHDIIEKARERIAQAEADIEQNLKDQKDAEKKIEDQSKVVEEVKTKLENVGKK